MNSSDTLRAHLKRLKDTAAPDASGARDAWLDALDRLMGDLREWLGQAEREELLRVTQQRVSVEEDHYGTYEAPALIVSAPGRLVHITPVGLDVLGTAGRVDMDCGPRKVRLLRQHDGAWMLARSSRLSRAVLDLDVLDSETFSSALDDLMELDEPDAPTAG